MSAWLMPTSWRAVKESLTAEHKSRLKKIDEFVIRQVEKELKEFLAIIKALVEPASSWCRESRDSTACGPEPLRQGSR